MAMIKVMHRINSIQGLSCVPEEFGVEVDIRNDGKNLILSHEPSGGGESLGEFCKKFRHRLLVLNVKSEGIEEQACVIAEENGITDYFLLDLSMPSLIRLSERIGKGHIAVRFSEYEPIESVLCLAKKAGWVWVDTFTRLPLTPASYSMIREAGLKICLVDPERWGRAGEIRKYRGHLKRNAMEIDAVMTTAAHAAEWD